jgi:hypothetical protein
MAARSVKRARAASTVIIVGSAIAFVLVVGQLVLCYQQIANPPQNEGPMIRPVDYLPLVYLRLVLVAVQVGTGVLTRRRGRRDRWLVFLVWWVNAALLMVMLLSGTQYQAVASVAGLLIWTLMGGVTSAEADGSR